MQFTLLALPAVFLTSALAAPVLDSVDLDRVVDLDDVSLNALSVDTSTVDGVIEGAWEKKRQLDLDNLLDLDDLDLNVLSVDTSTVDGVIAEASQQTKRQAQPVVDLVHSLLETMAPLAEQICKCFSSKVSRKLRLNPSIQILLWTASPALILEKA